MRHSLPFFIVLFLAFILITTLSNGYPTGGNPSVKRKMITVSGKVIEQDSKLPINTTLIIEVAGFNSIKAKTDKHGNFTTEIPTTEEFKIIVDAPGFETQEHTIHYNQNEADRRNDIEIKLTPYIKSTIEGNILNTVTHLPIDVQFNLYKFSDFIIEDCHAIRDGKFSQTIMDYGWYMIDLSAPGYQELTDTIWVLNCKRKLIHKNYFLSPIEEGFTMKLNEIHFNFGKATLTTDSNAALEKVMEFLNNNPSIEVEISGHTDSEGPDNYNLFLSRLRAQAVVNYLADKGVNKSQMIAKGYGETKPIDSNETYTGRANNRRVELMVLKE